jgi:hypothetical protein
LMGLALERMSQPAQVKEDISPIAKMMIDQANKQAERAYDELKEMRTAMAHPKDEGFVKVLSMLKELKSWEQSVVPQGSEPSTIVQLAEVIAPHLGAILPALSQLGRAPQLPRPAALPAAGQSAQDGQAEQAEQPEQKKRFVVPQEAQDAIRAMVGVPDSYDGDQLIVEKLFDLVRNLVQTPEGRELGEQIRLHFLGCDSKPELRGLVTSIFRLTGDKSLVANEQATERITIALHRHYTFLFSALTGGKEKVLTDTAQAQVAETPKASEPAKTEALAGVVQPAEPVKAAEPRKGEAPVEVQAMSKRQERFAALEQELAAADTEADADESEDEEGDEEDAEEPNVAGGI